MFAGLINQAAGLINQAKTAASHLVLKYVARASIAIPFVIAAGFALAAIAVMLVERFGHVAGYWLMAGGLAAIGIIAALAVSFKEHEEGVAEKKAEQADTKHAAGDAAAQAMTQAPLALLGAAFTSPGGATAALKLARTLGRNWPIVLLAALIGALFWPSAEGEDLARAAEEGKPRDAQPLETLH
jgi:Na+/melibiose symporter-like transporter